MSSASKPTAEQIADEIRYVRNDINRLREGLAMPLDQDAIERKEAQLAYLLEMQKGKS